MRKETSLLLFIFLFAGISQTYAQQTCELSKPLQVTELRGRLLFEYQLNLFTLKLAGVSVSQNKNISSDNEILPEAK